MAVSRIGVKITEDKDGNIVKEKTLEPTADEQIKTLPIITSLNNTNEIIRKVKGLPKNEDNNSK
jgi:hypothetical protein